MARYHRGLRGRMGRPIWLGAAPLLATMLFTCSPARADIYTETYRVSASDFVQEYDETGPTTPPFDSMFGSFTVTFNTSVTGSGIQGGVVINSTTLPNAYADEPDIGWYLNSTATVLSFGTSDGDFVLGANTWVIQIDNPISDPTFASMTYGTSGESMFQAQEGTLVPEPSSLMLFGVGLIALIVGRRSVKQPSLA